MPTTNTTDTLKRKDEASMLLDILKSEQERRSDSGESLVISLAAPWGYGKTTFLKLIEEQAKRDHFVFYFDAWANDHSKDALTSFLAEFNSSLTAFADKHESPVVAGIEQTGKSILKGTKAVIKAAAPLVVGHWMKRAVGVTMDDLKSGYNDQDEEQTVSGDNEADEETAALITSKVATDIVQAALKSHTQTKVAGDALSLALCNLNTIIGDIQGYSPPIIILIDELDRCRPNYAIELLETMKHFFNSPGVVYIVANNADELGHSIKVLYGTEFDAAGYLKRFFDFEYRLKEPNTRLFCEAISLEYGFSKEDRFVTPLKIIHTSYSRNLDVSDDIVAWHLQLAIEFFELSLRDTKQIALRIHAVSIIAGDVLDLFLLVFMISADHKKSGSHRNMLIGGQNNWDMAVPCVVDIEFRDRPANTNGNFNTTMSSIFGFYGSAEFKLANSLNYEIGDSMSMLNREVLKIVDSMPSRSSPFEKKYYALVEQLSNLTM